MFRYSLIGAALTFSLVALPTVTLGGAAAFFDFRGTDAQGNDIWHFGAINQTEFDITAISLKWRADLVNTFPAPLTFNADPAGFAGFSESFFVIPAGFQASEVIASDVVDTSTMIAATFRMPGDAPILRGRRLHDFVPLLVLALPRGISPGHVFSYDDFRVEVQGRFVDVPKAPEPASGLMVCIGLGLMATGAGRRYR